MICRNCGTVQRGAETLPGSGWIELILWVAWILPGVIYSIWRRGSKPACVSCGSRDLVSTVTPVGQTLMTQYHPHGVPALPPAGPPPELRGLDLAVHRTTQVVLLSVAGLMLVAVVSCSMA